MSATRLSGTLFGLASRSTLNRSVSRLAHASTSRSFTVSSSLGQEGPWSDPITKPLHRYVVIAEDYSEPSALARRLEVRERHLEQAARGKEVGRIGE